MTKQEAVEWAGMIALIMPEGPGSAFRDGIVMSFRDALAHDIAAAILRAYNEAVEACIRNIEVINWVASDQYSNNLVESTIWSAMGACRALKVSA